MAYSPTNKDLANKIDRLPDELIKRLDDRYLKKDDAEKQYLTRRDAGMVMGVVTGLITILIGAGQFFLSIFNRGN
jgi:hypothetical protein